jgi:hypothetical protein
MRRCGWPSAAGRAKIARIAEGMDTIAPPAGRDLPAPVFIASLFGFAKGAFLGFMGIIGILTWEDVTDPWGFGALALAILFALASYALLRGKPFARLVLAALAVAGGVLALVYVFVGPTSAIPPSLVAAGLDALVLWLLYGPRSSKEYFGS